MAVVVAGYLMFGNTVGLASGQGINGPQRGGILNAALERVTTVVPERHEAGFMRQGQPQRGQRDNGISWWKVALGVGMIYGGNWMIQHEEKRNRLNTDRCFGRGGEPQVVNACIGSYMANEQWRRGAKALVYGGLGVTGLGLLDAVW